MSSSGLWKVENCVQPILTMGHSTRYHNGPLPKNMSQDEPIDFSQKSDDPKAGLKTECGTGPQNGYGLPTDNILSKGYGSLQHLYYVRNATDPLTRRPNSSCGELGKHGQDLSSIQSPDSISRMGNCNSTVASYHRDAIKSPSSHQSDGCRGSSKSPDGDVDMSSVPSPEDITLESNPINGKGQKRSLEEIGEGTDDCKEIPRPPETNVSGFPMLSKYLAAPQQEVGTSSDRIPMPATALAQMLTNNKNISELPKLSIPITNPMMVRKTNGSSPGIVNSPYQATFSPPVVVEDSSRTGPLVPMPNPWEVFSAPYYDDKKHHRSVRPFKAFGNDILNNCNPDILASVGLGGGSRSVAFDKYIKFRSDCMDRNDVTTTNNHPTGSSSPESVRRANDSNDSSPSPHIGNDDSQHDHHHRRRTGNRFPDNQKDPAYWERRRKNNEAAKRSRDARRRKEDALAMTAKELLEDKMRMTMHLTFQLKEMQKLEEENKFLKEREASLQTYLFHLESRCRDCTKCSSRGSEKRPAVQNQM